MIRNLIDFLLLCLVGGFGIYGVLHDFRLRGTVTRAGKVAIIGFSLALLLSIIGFWLRVWDEHEARQRTVEALAAELIANNSRMEDVLHPEEQEALNCALPELQSAVLKGVLANGMFAAQKDNKILELLTLLNERTEAFNERIRMTTELLSSADREGRREWRRKVKNGPVYLLTRDTITQVVQSLVAQYGLNAERRFFGEAQTNPALGPAY